MKKIAFLFGDISGTGGIGRVTSILSNELVRDNKVYLLSLFKKQEGNFYQFSPNIEVNILFNKPITMKSAIFNATNKIRKFIRTNEIDILICCSSLYFPVGVLATRFLKTKLICWDHTNFYVRNDYKFQIFCRRFGLYFCDRYLTISKQDKINYIKNWKTEKVGYIYNPIDSNLLKKNNVYKIDSKKIVSIGRLSDVKNFDLAIDIAEEVFNKNPEWEWHIWGEGELKEHLQEKIDSKNLQRKIILKGKTSDLYNILPEYSFQVMTSKYEGFPMTLLEGLACKLPLISFDIMTGPSEIISNNINGYLIPKFDKIDMINKIDYLIKNPEIRKEMSLNSNNNISLFSLESISNEWRLMFEEITDSFQ